LQAKLREIQRRLELIATRVDRRLRGRICRRPLRGERIQLCLQCGNPLRGLAAAC